LPAPFSARASSLTLQDAIAREAAHRWAGFFVALLSNVKEGTAMSHNWMVGWKGLIFAGHGVLIALVANEFVLDGPAWSKFLVTLFLAGLLGAIGHRIGQKQLRDRPSSDS
jgi:hypothetical protein